MRIEYSDVKNDFYTVYAILRALKLSAPPKCRSQEFFGLFELKRRRGEGRQGEGAIGRRGDKEKI